jgi:hypothetical protein
MDRYDLTIHMNFVLFVEMTHKIVDQKILRYFPRIWTRTLASVWERNTAFILKTVIGWIYSRNIRKSGAKEHSLWKQLGLRREVFAVTLLSTMHGTDKLAAMDLNEQNSYS